MERRKFIVIATAGAAAVAVPIGYYNYGRVKYDESLARPQLLSNIWDTETIAEIGQGYQEQYPAENSERSLVRRLSENLSPEHGSIAESIAWRIKEDYKTGKIITIDGWILSATEGRQCALFALTQKK